MKNRNDENKRNRFQFCALPKHAIENMRKNIKCHRNIEFLEKDFSKDMMSGKEER